MDEQSKESLAAEIQNAEDVIKKLKKFAEELKNTDNNILTHLCDGLETFLGFDPSSKGYDGSGIVYSDLDRLCDGVMGFLSGVLEAVKNTQTYNVGRKTLQNLVSKEINNHLCSGHDGFKKLLPSLTNGIEKYNREVRESNEKVKKPIEDLLNQVGDAFTQKVQNILSQETDYEIAAKVQEAEKQIRQQLEACQKHAKQFTDTFKITNKVENTDLKIVINHFNSTLQPRVNSALKAVCHDKQRLEQLSATENANLNKMLDLISTKLGGIKTSVIEQINVNIKQLVSDLKGLVGNIILTDLKKIDRRLVQYVEDLQKWIDTSDKIVDNTVDEIGYIIHQGPGKNSQRALKSIASSVDLWKDKMVEYIKNVTELTAQIHEKIMDLGKAFPKEHNGQQKGEPRKTIHEVFEHLRTNVAQIKGSRKAFYRGFEGIEEAVKDYTQEFGNRRFADTILTRWITEILEKEPVRTQIDWYWQRTGRGFEDPYNGRAKLKDGGLTKKIASCIMSGIGYAINAAQLQISPGGLDVAENIRAVNAVCGAFSTELSELIKRDAEQRDLIEEIARAIDRSFQRRAAPLSGADPNGYLERAVRCMLQQLVGIAQGAAAELHSLTLDVRPRGSETGIAGKISEAHEKAKNVLNQLNTATGAGGGTKYSQLLDDAVNQAVTKAAELNADYMTGIFAGWSKEIKDNLSDLLKAFTHTGNNIKQQLAQLKETISNGAPSKGLQQIHHLLSQLHSVTVAKAIKEADDILKIHAPTLQAKYLKELTSYVEEKVTDAQNALTHEARKRYVCDVKGLVTEFSKKVVTELQKLPDAINRDLNTGIKGIMKNIETDFISAVKGLASVDPANFKPNNCPLAQASEILNGAFMAFINALKTQTDFTFDFRKIKPSHDALTKLLIGVKASMHFNNDFLANLERLNCALATLYPSKFGEPTTVLSQVLKVGMKSLANEFDKAYVNRYSGLEFDEQLVDEDKISEYGRKCAKVCLTLLPAAYDGLTKLKDEGKLNLNTKVCKISNRNEPIGIGTCLNKCGYAVAENENSKDGELKHPSFKFTGKTIYDKIFETKYQGEKTIPHLKACESNRRKKPDQFDIIDLFECLIHHIDRYNELCHIPTASSTKVPRSIYDMLAWFGGLPYSAVYPTLLRDTISDLLTDKAKQKPQEHDGLEFTVIDPASQSLAAYPNSIPYSEVVSALEHLCSKSHDILTCIVGYGDAYTTYGCDYCNNAFGFKYPSSGEDCLQMITDLLRRLLHCLRYLQKQCGVTAKHNGWSDCRFGRDVKSAKWECKDHSTDEPNCQANDKATCQPKCKAKSPLQSYLTDCLYGHLPHQLTSVGCKSTCKSCPGSAPGMPCLTPLGFRGFSGSTRKGTDLCEVLDAFFSNAYLSSLFTLVPRPPATLPEHIGFALSLAAALNAGKPVTKPVQESFSDAFEKSIKEATISLHDNPSNYTAAVKNAYKNTKSHDGHSHPPATAADVYTLMFPSTCLRSSDDRVYCAPYLYTLGTDTHHYLAYQNTNLYLSWTVYLPWTFYAYLRSLLDAFKNISCQEWECSKCMHRGKCKKGQHGVDYNCQCRGIIECRGVSSAFHKYGLTFGNPATLSAVEGKRYCHNFYHQLVNVLNSNCFAKLFGKCDEFLWIIRQPFTYLVLALWSLSLFYLICVMVGRLDVLHIRSHLRIPSSHKIAAQSLLAAAQVGRLAKISYLQP